MEANTINKYKNKSYSQLHKTAKKWFNQFIRLRDTDDYGYGVCISSGNRLKYGSMNSHAGHLFSGGKFKNLEFNEDKVHLQGRSDNYYNHGNEAAYTINLINKIGVERVSELQRLSILSKRMPFKQDRYYIIDIIEKYKVKVKELAKGKMFEIN